jgi:deoxycytidine triphosphate deaminase
MIILRRNYENKKINITRNNCEVEHSSATDMNHKEQVAYDFHVGERFQKPNDHNQYGLNGGITINPGTCILISTAESVTLPSDVFGVMCSRGSLAAKGLFVGNTKIDPTFSGTLNIPVFNASSNVIHMKQGDAFCTAYFSILEQPVPPGVSKKAPEVDAHNTSRFSRICDFFRVNGLVLLLNALIAGTTAYAATIATQNGATVNSPPPKEGNNQ